MRAARRDGESKSPPVRGGVVEILDYDNGVVDSDDILKRHSFVSPPSAGNLS
jgi:hypothetical protein